MTPQPPLTAEEETLTQTLRQLARRSHQFLKENRAGTAEDARQIVADIDRTRVLLSAHHSAELLAWLDHLENRVRAQLQNQMLDDLSLDRPQNTPNFEGAHVA